MGLGNRRHIRYGVPDAVALALSVVVGLSGVFWLRANSGPVWERTTGRVVSCELVRREYGDTSGPEQVRLTYEYTAEGKRHTGYWEGFWPQANSPNALPIPELAKLRTPGYSLTVVYDPANPIVNMLHRDANTQRRFYPWITLGLLGMTLAYLLTIYPVWKRQTH